nr:hypothetical protein [Tanacetum cinerariifolium]
MSNVKKFVAERTRHQRQYERRINKRHMQTQENKIDTGKAIDVDLVVTKSSGTKSEVQDDNSGSGNDTDADDADFRPIYDEELMAEVQLTAKIKERMLKYTRFNAQSFKDAMIFNMDSIGKYMLEIILHQQRTPHLLKQKKLMQTQEDHSNPIPALNVDSMKVNSVVIQTLVLRNKTVIQRLHPANQ